MIQDRGKGNRRVRTQPGRVHRRGFRQRHKQQKIDDWMGVQFQQGTNIVGIEKAVTCQLIVNGVRAGRWVICNNGGNMASLTQQRLQTHVHPHPLFTNNQSFILFAKNNISNNRTKHIDMHYHYTCNEVTVGNIQLHYIPRTANPANILTKALSLCKHGHILNMLGICHA